ncbi:hypothetical protein SARC_09853 [Sphaeroforma arctica JP610]|uniref:Aminotransferase class V domain-containing protein n=1 Tax=Sphaeroforma arctica JP610 TaxID=667725 RepID=A0A0L0FMH4_9EUKA|nr:hypothetical protein SARC_09853 [Sphaeroforma arctica JP610]KNC77691.1 hypothetical protein SARC_09853 [Sphaeroforma arctica JP610]|eukprot:XP_014151593.1 hypothetical protein SARC_09853 [Sphaeroforma arctica JP610]
MIALTYAPISSLFLSPFVALFLLDNEWTFVNHGAFGAANRLSFETAQKWQRYLTYLPILPTYLRPTSIFSTNRRPTYLSYTYLPIESQPLRYIDRVLLPQMAHVTRLLAQHVGTDACDLGLLPNATSGLNAVFQRIPLTAEDSLFILSLSYGSVKKMAKESCRRTGAEYCEAQITFAHNSSTIDFVALVERELPVNAKVAVFDHVTSNTAIILPIQELTDLCHRRGCLVVVDGAHGLGQFDLNLRSLGADVYISNCHKWFTCPKGIGFVRATAEVQKWLRPVIISHGWGKGFVSEFMWQATSLAQKWKSQTLVPLEMSGLMALIQIPTLDRKLSDIDGNAVQDAMHFRFQIECPVKFIDGQLYVRISSHCYNTRHDYDKLAAAVLCLVKDLKID